RGRQPEEGGQGRGGPGRREEGSHQGREAELTSASDARDAATPVVKGRAQLGGDPLAIERAHLVLDPPTGEHGVPGRLERGPKALDVTLGARARLSCTIARPGMERARARGLVRVAAARRGRDVDESRRERVRGCDVDASDDVEETIFVHVAKLARR